MLRQIKAVLFDLDGTLIDSNWVWRKIDKEYLGRYGHELPENLASLIEGMSITEVAVYFKEQFGIPDTLEEMKDEWISMAKDKYLHQVPLKPGAREFLDYLKGHGILTGIASSNRMDLVEAVLDAHHIRDSFDTIHTCCEVERGKPDPAIYLLSADSLGMKPEECLVLEDVPMGILAGKRAGMRTCAVEDDQSACQREEKRRLADYYMNDYYDILRQYCEDWYGYNGK